jgi:hypothetical protein
VRAARQGERRKAEAPLGTGSGDFGRLFARPSEYEAVTTEWLERTVAFLMLVRDPLYAQLRSEQVEGLACAKIDVGGGQELPVEPQLIAVSGSIDIDSVITGDFGGLHGEVSDIADQRLEQTMQAYFALVMDVTQRTGNVAEAHGDAAEGILAVLEMMDMQFDANGDPADAERVRAHLDALTPDQQRRFAEVISRKREAYRASRRRRRLPRLGY